MFPFFPLRVSHQFQDLSLIRLTTHTARQSIRVLYDVLLILYHFLLYSN